MGQADRQTQSAAPHTHERPADKFLVVARVFTVFLLGFGSVAVAVAIGYETREGAGAVWGMIFGLALTLMAMWAIYVWSDLLAKIASGLALFCLVTLVLGGLVTALANLAGIALTFWQGLLIVLGLTFLIGAFLLYRFLIWMDPDSGLARWDRGELYRDRER